MVKGRLLNEKLSKIIEKKHHLVRSEVHFTETKRLIQVVLYGLTNHL